MGHVSIFFCLSLYDFLTLYCGCYLPVSDECVAVIRANSFYGPAFKKVESVCDLRSQEGFLGPSDGPRYVNHKLYMHIYALLAVDGPSLAGLWPDRCDALVVRCTLNSHYRAGQHDQKACMVVLHA